MFLKIILTMFLMKLCFDVLGKIDLGIDINDFLVNVIYFNVYNVGVVEDEICFFFYCYV